MLILESGALAALRRWSPTQSAPPQFEQQPALAKAT
jgi:hypothetical protein